MKKILVITSQAEDLETLNTSSVDVAMEVVKDRLTAVEQIKKDEKYDFFLIDVDYYLENPLFDNSSRENLTLNFKDLLPAERTVLLANSEEINTAVELVKTQVAGYLTFPIRTSEIKLLIDQVESQERRSAEIEYLRDQFWDTDSKSYVKTDNEKMKDVFVKIKDVAPTKSTVLLCGDTGVGKGVIAKLIHKHSSRKSAQFIHVHCGAIPENLIESELFGHEKGAFTGAIKRKIGKFELAHRGTIFLDEISTLSASAQIKLLQVLQDSVFQRVGGESDVKIDIRVIAATNEDLKKLSDEGKFRRDLYYRLNVFPVQIPSLNERTEDIPLLVEVFIKKLNSAYTKEIKGIQPEALQILMKYDWPGNIRELENLVERAYILEKTPLLTAESFPIEIFEQDSNSAVLPLNLGLPLAEARSRVLENFERQYLKEILLRTKGRINEAAKIAGIGPRQLNKLMNKYTLLKEEFKDSKEIFLTH